MTRVPAWPRVYGGPFACGKVKAHPQDFAVEEVLSFEPSGEGEHVFLLVEKQELNTEQVAQALARFAGVPRHRIGYAGLKDRQAVARQWFSVHVAGRELPWTECCGGKFRVLRFSRNRRKLRRGALRGNRFRVRVREVQGEREGLARVLTAIASQGLANYFGPQRFGHAGANLVRAEAWFRRGERVARHLRGLYLSAARSFLFNQVLAARIERGDWNKPIPGDWLMFDGSGAGFLAATVEAELKARVEALELHPSGPLWGKREEGKSTAGLAALLERQVAEAHPEFAQALEAKAEEMRRPLRVRVEELTWGFEKGDLFLEFFLPKGAYATSLVRELVEI
jgi:tRNA pseudouridine13 synthase